MKREPPRSGGAPGAEWLVGGGEMGDRIRSFDWSRTPWGPRERWPASLRAVVDLVLGCRFPMALLWGRDLRLVYNDAFRAIAAGKHPGALGEPARELWPEAWRADAPRIAAVMDRGETVYLEEERFPIDQHGRREDRFFALSLSPVRAEDGTVGGTLVALQETTRQVAERARLQKEHELALDVFEHGDACYVLDSQFRYVLVNKAQEQSSGRRREETLGRCIWDLWPDAAGPDTRFWEVYHRVMERRVPETFEEYFAPLDLWADIRVFPTSEGGLAVFFRRINERKRVEAERDRYSQQRQIALDAAHLGWWHYDPATKVSTCDVRFREIFGIEGSERPYEEILTLLNPDDLPHVWAAVEAALDPSDPKPYSSEYRITRPDGRVRWIEAHGLAMFEGEGPARRATSLVGTVADITDRRRTEEALSARERRFRTLIENLYSAVALVDASGRFTLYNQRFLSLFGLSPDSDVANVNEEDWSAWQVFDESGRLLHVDEHPVRRAFRTSQPVRNQLVGVRAPSGGPLTWMLVSAAPLLEIDGTVEHVICTYYDVTERKNAEEALRESELRFRQLADSMPQLVWTAQPDGKVDFYNNRFREFAGLSQGPDGSWHWEPVVHAEDLRATADAWADSVRTGQPYEIAHRVKRSDGGYRWFLSRGTPVRDDAGRITKWFGTATDIHQQKQAEEALREADRRKNEFLAMLSHELRNPLAPIKNSLYIIDRTAPGGQRAKRAQEVIDRQVQHLTRLIDDLLDVTRISRGKIRLQNERLELCELVHRTAEDHRSVFKAAGVDLRILACAGPLHANGDPTRIAQAIGNLLGNAVKFTPRGGWVELRLGAEDGRASIHVRDNGAGIAPDLLNKLFRPFVQADATLDRSRGGLGLGLALVKGLVELHGGSVAARSEGAGKGAEFVVTLPLSAGLAPPLHRAALEAPAARQALRVLLIEDNVDAAESLKEALELNGHQVETAATGLVGIDKARSFHPDVVLCDIGLPEMDGFEVARRMKADPALRAAPLVALSGYAGPEDLERSKQAGFDRHIAKPPSMEALENVLAQTRRRHAGAPAASPFSG